MLTKMLNKTNDDKKKQKLIKTNKISKEQKEMLRQTKELSNYQRNDKEEELERRRKETIKRGVKQTETQRK